MPPTGLEPDQKNLSRTAEASWRGLLNAIPVAAYTCDARGLISYFNPLAESVWGRAPKLRDQAERYCGSFRLYLSNGTPIRHDECWMALALRRGRQYNGREILIERSDGSRTLGLAHANPLRNDQGKIIGAVNLVVDLTAQKLGADPGKARSTASISRDAALAIVEIGVSLLAGMAWESSTFS
jgi:PAS domain S-box-containing protein